MQLHDRLHAPNNHFDLFPMPLLAQASFPGRTHEIARILPRVYQKLKNEERFGNQVDFAVPPSATVLRGHLVHRSAVVTVVTGTVKVHGCITLVIPNLDKALLLPLFNPP